MIIEDYIIMNRRNYRFLKLGEDIPCPEQKRKTQSIIYSRGRLREPKMNTWTSI